MMKKDYLPETGTPIIDNVNVESNPKKKSNLLRILTFLMTLAVIGIIAYITFDKWEEIRSFPWRLNFINLLLVILFHSLSVAVSFVVWHLIISRLGEFNNLRLNVRYFYISYLSNRLPTSIPFISARLIMYRKEGIPTAAIVNGMFLEQLLITISGVVVFLLFLPAYTNVPDMVVKPLATLGLAIILTLLWRPQIIIEVTNKVLTKFHKPTLEKIPSRRDMLVWMGIYTLPWIFAGLSFFYVPRALTDIRSLGYYDSLSISTLATLVSFLNIVIPGGIAIKELAFTGLVASRMPLPVALVLAFAYRLIHTGDEILWAVFASFIPAND